MLLYFHILLLLFSMLQLNHQPFHSCPVFAERLGSKCPDRAIQRANDLAFFRFSPIEIWMRKMVASGKHTKNYLAHGPLKKRKFSHFLVVIFNGYVTVYQRLDFLRYLFLVDHIFFRIIRMMTSMFGHL